MLHIAATVGWWRRYTEQNFHLSDTSKKRNKTFECELDADGQQDAACQTTDDNSESDTGFTTNCTKWLRIPYDNVISLVVSKDSRYLLFCQQNVLLFANITAVCSNNSQCISFLINQRGCFRWESLCSFAASDLKKETKIGVSLCRRWHLHYCFIKVLNS